MAQAPTFTIVLVSIDDELDSHATRRFSLPIDSTFPIGRASSNLQKRHLMSAPDNAYIDSPVVSREHAVLSANTDSGKPRVYITDRNSMHGTMVNEEKLEPMEPKMLLSGDLLQFGADVNRNDNSFLARKYIIETSLDTPETRSQSFSNGFTVPEADSSEDEEVEIEVLENPPAPPSTQYGSQNNPVTIDDEPKHTVIEIIEDTVVEVPHSHSAEVRTTSPPAAQPASYEDLDSDVAAPDSMDAMSFSIYSSDEGEDIENDDDEDGSDISSDNWSIASSEPNDLSESDPAEAEIEEDADVDTDTDAVRRMKLEAMLNHERENVPQEEAQPLAASLSVPPVALSSTPVQPSSCQLPAPFYPPQDIAPMSVFDNPFVDCAFTPGSLPPRPSAPKPSAWGTVDFGTPLAAHDSHWWTEEAPVSATYLGTNFGDRPVLFSPAPLPSVVDPMQPKPLTQNWAPTTPPSDETERVQSPVPIPTDAELLSPQRMPSGPTTPDPPQRRTKVTIPEIVEDHQTSPSPPTPTSVASRKRKADALEEDEDAGPVNEPADPAGSVDAVETGIQGRPKKRLRSRIGSAISTAAAYVVPGTAVAMGLFMYLPDSFFAE